MKRSGNKGLSRYLCLWAAISILAVSGLIVTIQPNHAFETKEGKVNLASKTMEKGTDLFIKVNIATL